MKTAGPCYQISILHPFQYLIETSPVSDPRQRAGYAQPEMNSKRPSISSAVRWLMSLMIRRISSPAE